MAWQQYIPEDISELYEVYDYKHAAAILSQEFPQEFDEICTALRSFTFTDSDILIGGGNESRIPKILSDILRPMGWIEKNLGAELAIYELKGRSKTLTGTINQSSHKVDYLKGRVAFDLEWNSKDQTFDRDLYAMRAFFDYNAISVGIILTRSCTLNPIFRQLNILSKYGASTTHMGKLLPRLEAGRSGGCPVLAFGITPELRILNT